MLFTSWSFALFLPAAVIVHRLLRGRARTWFLLAASYYFYAVWDLRFLTLIWVSTAVDYLAAHRIASQQDERARRRWLLLSVVANLSILGFFKYWNFFADSTAALLEGIGFHADPMTLSIILPVGISFYTFQTMSYTIDVYRRRIDPEARLDVFALYVAFFPQLVAGPIERAERLLPQLRDTTTVGTAEDLRQGAWLIGRGLFRKLAIADAVAPYVQTAFAEPARASTITLVVGAIGFGLQIYGDFAGYTDIARGAGRLLGVDLIQNFRQPYLSRSITEFWRRWHISLSAWLRDYLYIPLGGSRHGRVATYRNLLVTMLLGGLWHGAAWTFVVWGGLHGLYLAVERMLPDRWSVERRTSRVWIAVTALLVTLTWIPFRASTLGSAVDYLVRLFSGGWALPDPSAVFVVATGVVLTMLVDRIEVTHGDVNPLVPDTAPLARGFAYGFAAVAVVILSGTDTVPFIYFQF